MSKSIPIQAKLLLSKLFPPGSSKITFGHYQIQPIPLSSAIEGEAMLSFIYTYEDPVGQGSWPEGEINIICKLLSVFFNARIKNAGSRIDEKDIFITEELERTQYPQFFGVFDPTHMEKYFVQLLSLDEDLARQFIRACHAYSFALEFIPSDTTFAFFLLVVAAECMSSQNKIIPASELSIDSQKCERFCHFLTSFLLKEYKGIDENNETLFKELLKTAYYSHRSGFVHGGKEVSSAAQLADKLGSAYFKHEVEGKEIRTPGLGWFAKIVRGALLGYLLSLPPPSNTPINKDMLSQLAFEKMCLKVKLKKDIEKGQAATSENIEYR